MNGSSMFNDYPNSLTMLSSGCGICHAATIPSEVASIAKNLIGSGVLSLSGGIAVYSNSPDALFSGSLWVVVLGTIFGYFW